MSTHKTALLGATMATVLGCDPDSVRSTGGDAVVYCFAAQ